MSKAKKEKSPPTEHWQKLVDTYFDFYEKNFDGEKPSFDGSAPRDFKSIIEALKYRAEIARVEWTVENAAGRLLKFLDAAKKDLWLGQNFLLFNLNRQKDKIFLSIKKQSNGTAHLRGSQTKPTPTINTQGGFGNL